MQLSQLGYQLLAISGEAPSALVETSEKLALTITLLADPDLALMRQMGIVFQSPGKQPLPAPSVCVTSRKGDILFQHVDPNFRVRLNNEVILAVARAFKSAG